MDRLKPMLPNEPRGVRRVNDRRLLNGVFWVLRSGAPWRDHPDFVPAGGPGYRLGDVPCADNHRLPPCWLPSDPEIAIIKTISGVVWEFQVNWRPTAKGTQGEKSRRDRNLPWRFSIPVSSAAM